MKKKTFIRSPTFVCALLLILLVSSLMVTTVWAKPDKPDRPGKSVKTWDLKIWIGDPAEDIDLTVPEYLVAEDVPCSGNLWDLPKKKGKGSNPSNYLSAQVDLIGWDEEDWCTWELADVEGYNSTGQTVSLGFFDLDSLDTAYVSIRHGVMPSGADYWTFVIQWIVEFNPSTTYKFFEFRAGTDRDENLEGTLDDEGWLVPFNDPEAILFSDWTDADLDGELDNYDWKGPVSFTVEIKRTPAES